MARYGPEPRFYPRAALYVLKMSLFEPFWAAERLAFRGQPRTLPTDPVFILGYYRSGTTHLQEIMLRDERFGFMSFYHGFWPTAFNSTQRWLEPVVERIITATGFRHPAHDIPFSFSLPAECDVAQVASGFRLAANWGQLFPTHFREIYGKTGLFKGITDEELAAFRWDLADLHWRVSRMEGHKQLLLKSPPHTGRLGFLLDMYPNAKFIFLRRNPYDAFQSNLKLWRSLEGQHLERFTPELARDNILWSHDEAHIAYERDKPRLRPGQLIELDFESFMAEPMTTLQSIYETLDLGDFERVRATFADYLRDNHVSERPPYMITDADRALVKERLGTWIEAWGYEEPPRRAAGGAQ